MSSFNQDKLKNDLRWMEEGVFFLCLLFDGATALWFHLWGCITSGLQHGQTQLYLWMNWARGLHIFCFRKIWFFFFFFAYSTMLFIEWNLRDFSPCWLQPSLNFACVSLLKIRIEAFLHMLGLQVILFFCLSHHCCQQSWTLPQLLLGSSFFVLLQNI